MLRAGGNAYDAAVAAGFAGAVAEPSLTSLAGGGFLLAVPRGDDAVLFDFFVDVPGLGRSAPEDPLDGMTAVTIRFRGDEQVFHVGAGSLAVPGALAGYLHVHARLGRLDLAEVVRPAIALARSGVVLGAGQAAVVRLLEPIMTLEPEGRARYGGRDGRPFADDQRVTNEPLAAFLEDVAAERRRGFGDADLGPRIVADLAARGGRLTLDDLAAHRVIEREPLDVTVSGLRIRTNPSPSYGGELVVRALAALGSDPTALGAAGSAVRLGRLTDVLDEVTRWHRERGTVERDAVGGTPQRPNARRGTTHVSVVDDDGNLAAMTTSNGATSGVHLADTGVMANNVMGEEDLHPLGFGRLPPGMRIGSMMAPTVIQRAGHPAVALGSGGSERIRSALTQVVALMVHDGYGLAAAVGAPRLHPGADAVQLEPGHDAGAVAALAAIRPVNVWDAQDLYFGGVNAVDAHGGHAADPRRGGASGTA